MAGFALGWALFAKVPEAPHIKQILLTFGLALAIQHIAIILWTGSPFDDTSVRHIVVSDRRCARGGRPPHHIVPGAVWHEYSSGNNAVGTALALGRPLHIHAEEHFCEVTKPWSCTAAVIRDAFDRHIVRAVDITGPPDTVNAQTWPSPLRSDR